MKTPDNSNPNPQLSFLSIGDFRKIPEKITDYKFGDKLTRENFTSFLIYSFAISRGNSKTQQAFLLWVGKKDNFDYRESIRFFMVSGGWHTLSVEEKERFKKAFRSIGKHDKNNTIDERTKEAMKEDVGGDAVLAEELQDQIGYLDRSSVLTYELEGIDTIDQFKEKFYK